MNCDLLLTWMTHVGKGSWTSFRKAAVEIADEERDPLALCRRLRVGFSDLGFADFFVDGTQRWQILPPVLGGLAANSDAAVLYGGRTPALVEALRNAAEEYGGRLEEEVRRDRPTSIRVVGDTSRIASIAKRIGVVYEPKNARCVAEHAPFIPYVLKTARQEPAPLNWAARYFDFGVHTWVHRRLSNAACEFRPTHGASKYFVRRKSGKLLRMSKRESIYAAAMLKGLRLIEYEPSTMRLSVPLFAPMPTLFARAASLCTCRPAEIVGDRLVYVEVTFDVATLLMVAAGQPHPGAAGLARTPR